MEEDDICVKCLNPSTTICLNCMEMICESCKGDRVFCKKCYLLHCCESDRYGCATRVKEALNFFFDRLNQFDRSSLASCLESYKNGDMENFELFASNVEAKLSLDSIKLFNRIKEVLYDEIDFLSMNDIDIDMEIYKELPSQRLPYP